MESIGYFSSSSPCPAQRRNMTAAPLAAAASRRDDVPRTVDSIACLPPARGVHRIEINWRGFVGPLTRRASRNGLPVADYGCRPGGGEERRPDLAAGIDTVRPAILIQVIAVQSHAALASKQIDAALLKEADIDR